MLSEPQRRAFFAKMGARMGHGNKSLMIQVELTPQAREWMSEQIRDLRRQGVSADIAIGMALMKATSAGFDIPGVPGIQTPTPTPAPTQKCV